MDLTLVPFGYRPDEDDFVDVAEVPRGKASGCICWSCRMPLVARQGDIKQWHFAHATRGNYRDTKDKCEFSFFVSVRMMARQVVKGSLALDLPAYRESIDGRSTNYSRPKSIVFTVTEASSVILSEVEVDTSFSGVSVDLVGTIAGFTFVVYFVHPGRDVPSALKAGRLTNRKSGIIAIDLGDLAALFARNKGETLAYAGLLEEFLSHHTDSKHWVFHPRYDQAKAQAMLQIPVSAGIASVQASTPAQGRRGNFHCVVCQLSWVSTNCGVTICPKCQSHLYVSFKGYLE